MTAKMKKSDFSFSDRSGKETSGEENLKDFNNLMKEMR